MAGRGAKLAGMLLAPAILLGLGLGTAAQEGAQRVIRGQVLDENGKLVHLAIVHLKNATTEKQWSVVTSKEGRYVFHEVENKQDYEIYAEWQGRKSRTRKISQFDTRPIVRVNLKLKPAENGEEAEDEKEEEKNED